MFPSLLILSQYTLSEGSRSVLYVQSYTRLARSSHTLSCVVWYRRANSNAAGALEQVLREFFFCSHQ